MNLIQLAAVWASLAMLSASLVILGDAFSCRIALVSGIIMFLMLVCLIGVVVIYSIVKS